MVEGHLTWDFVPGVDQQAYTAWAKKAIGTTLQQPGLIEFRANRNLCGSPHVLVVTVWEAAADWATFLENTWAELEVELHAYVVNIHYVVWGTSPVVPKALHPAK
jgi:heme-degrading monooxygenase HmoA